MGMLLMLTNSCEKDEKKDDPTPTPTPANVVKDIDGNEYHTVKIGTQIWMAENLKVTKFNDGTAIPLVTDGSAWENLTTPAYCFYDNIEATYKNTYGALYNWYTANTGKLSPAGWHVPTDAEWTTLTSYLGGESVAGGKLKEAGTTHWQSPNTGATNESGFTALPGGYRYDNTGIFNYIGTYGFWLSSTEESTKYFKFRGAKYQSAGIWNARYSKKGGFSVRCVKD